MNADWSVNLRTKNNSNNNQMDIIETISRVAPDIIKTLEKRYSILRIIKYFEPIGRRSISNKVNISERVVRTEANILKDEGLIEISYEGMKLTTLGKTTIEKLDSIFHNLKGLTDLEMKLKDILGVKDVFIVSGSVDESPLVYKEIGKVAAKHLMKFITKGNIVGLTGGSTVYHVVDEIELSNNQPNDITIIPARGGLGKKVEHQANTLVEKLARKINASYKTLYTPDHLSKNAIKSLKEEPSIKEIVKLIDKIDVLVFGIGRSDAMAKRRGLEEDEINRLIEKGAVSEAFGYYFDKYGNIVHEISTIGISLDKFKSLENIIAVAAGISKAEAIMSISKLNKNLVLVTDENSAKKIINNYKEEN